MEIRAHELCKEDGSIQSRSLPGSIKSKVVIYEPRSKAHFSRVQLIPVLNNGF